MCNIAGWISNNRDRVAETEKGILAPMTRTMERPGPDAGGLLLAATSTSTIAAPPLSTSSAVRSQWAKIPPSAGCGKPAIST